jgi:hypothetical protein
MILEQKNRLKQNKTGKLTTKNYTFERGEKFQYLGVTFREARGKQTTGETQT